MARMCSAATASRPKAKGRRLSEHEGQRPLSSVAIRTLSAEPTPRLASAPPTSRDSGPKPGSTAAALCDSLCERGGYRVENPQISWANWGLGVDRKNTRDRRHL